MAARRTHLHLLQGLGPLVLLQVAAIAGVRLQLALGVLVVFIVITVSLLLLFFGGNVCGCL